MPQHTHTHEGDDKLNEKKTNSEELYTSMPMPMCVEFALGVLWVLKNATNFPHDFHTARTNAQWHRQIHYNRNNDVFNFLVQMGRTAPKIAATAVHRSHRNHHRPCD